MPDTIESPSFLVLQGRVPGELRELLTEADGCLDAGFVTGGTACAQNALQALWRLEKIDGPDLAARLRGLTQKHPAVSPMLLAILKPLGEASPGQVLKFDAPTLKLFTTTLKAIAYELYVVGAERAERLTYIRDLAQSVTKGVGTGQEAPADEPAVVSSGERP